MQYLMNYLYKSDKMKHITIFLSVCWILWFSQIFAISTMFGGLPDIPATPAVITLGDKTPELIIDSMEDNIEEEIIPSSDLSTNHTDNNSALSDEAIMQNELVILPDTGSIKNEVVLPHEIPLDDRPKKIDDSGGTQPPDIHNETRENQNIGDNETTFIDIPPSTLSPEVNITVEENPIPVFSEWAQKQMEEAEKKLEKQVANSSSMKKNATIGNKPQLLKIRAKNYASPDCGAKIIASNSEAENTGALLTSSKDEYMLSPCTNRIWFVVELCEAIQAEKIELANFELFSSSPKNFSVAVSNRFPTREWSNVGRFEASDQRNIQSFELFPHLFGKFVRVDVHSHYNSEHFCPISLFRVYGTSEFEAFETENRPPLDDIDEYDDEFGMDQNNLKNENNLFKSASDAVMSIVKKAAEVLVKTTNKTEDATGNDTRSMGYNICFTPKGEFSCHKCNSLLVENVNHLLSCRYNQLISLLSIDMLRNHIKSSQICATKFNLDIVSSENVACKQSVAPENYLVLNENQSYILSSLSLDYIAAMCHILMTTGAHAKRSEYRSDSEDGADTALNLTIDQKSGDNFLEIDDLADRKTRKMHKLGTSEENEKLNKSDDSKKLKEDRKPILAEDPVVTFHDQRISPPDLNDSIESTQTPQPPVGKEKQSDIKEDLDAESVEKEPLPVVEESPANVVVQEEKLTDDISPPKTEESIKPKEEQPESGSWESIDNLLSEQSSNEALNVPNIDAGSTNPPIPQKVHSESVFLRLSNRIKALERNMSLSGQYLEELSRRYKKQVEELQHSFAKTLSTIEEQERRALERENILADQNAKLRGNLEELSLKFNTWLVLVICIGAVVVLQMFVSWFLIRSVRCQYIQLLKKYEESSLVKRRVVNTKKLLRRKSLEGVSGHPSPTNKLRRPSEEAMQISGSYKDLLVPEEGDNKEISRIENTSDATSDALKRKAKQKQRRISLVYRQESAPGDFNSPTETTTAIIGPNRDDRIILDEDYETYLPGSDLAYNEFMPEGPSGSQTKVSNGNLTGLSKLSKKSNKVRRLSSPSFLKSPFSKSGSKKLPHGPTGWEWYRTRKTENKSLPSSQTENKNSNQERKKSSSPNSSPKMNGFSKTSASCEFEILHTSSDDSLRTSGTSTTTGSLLSNADSLRTNAVEEFCRYSQLNKVHFKGHLET